MFRPNYQFEDSTGDEDYSRKLRAVETKFMQREIDELVDLFGKRSFDMCLSTLSFKQIQSAKPCDLRGDLVMTSEQLQLMLGNTGKGTSSSPNTSYTYTENNTDEITNKHGLHGIMCARSEKYRKYLNYKREIFNVEVQESETREKLDLNDKIEWYSVSVELMLMRLKYLFGGSVRTLATIQNILVDEMSDLKKLLEGFLASPNIAEFHVSHTNKRNWSRELDKLSSYLTDLEERTSSETCKSHIQNVYDLIDDIKYSI